MISNENNDAFFDAAAKNDLEALKVLVEEKSVPVTATNHIHQTAVHIAARKGHLDVVKYLLEKDPTLVQVKDNTDQTVLHVAVMKGFLDFTKYLIDKYNADIMNPTGLKTRDSLLHLAARNNRFNIFKYFVEEKNMDVSLTNNLGQPPAFSAAAGGSEDIIKYIIAERNADVTMLDSLQRNILYKSAELGSLEVPKYLLDDRKLIFNINHRDVEGETVIHRAAKGHRIRFIQYLVEEKNADVNVADKDGKTPLHAAAKAGNLKLVKFLVSHKANAQAKDVNGGTPAKESVNKDVINYLEEVTSGKKITRRSVPELMVPTGLQRGPFWHGNYLGDGSEPKSLTEVSLYQVDTMLMLANACISYMLGSSYPHIKSEEEPMWSRVDPVALQAIHDLAE